MPTRKRAAAKRPRRISPRELSPSDLRWICRPSDHDLSGAEKDQSLIGIIGQERAIKALRLGIELYSPGYNIFVCASKAGGTGRASSVQKILNRIKGYCPLPPDRCYVHNFTKSDEPRLLELPRGCGEQLRSDMRRFSKVVQADLQSLLESEEHGKKRERIVSKYEGEGDRIIEKFERRAEREGFALKRVREGNVSRPELFPVLHGQATPIGDLERMVTEGKVPQRKAETIARQYQGLRQNLEETARRSRDLLSRMESEISDLEKKEARNVLQQRAEAMLRRYPADTAPRLAAYLQEVTEYLLERLDLFRRQTLSASPSAGATSGADESEDDGRLARHALQRLLDLLRVNVIFDSRRQEACPVVVETHPSYRRLFGYFEKALDPSGHWTSDFSRVRSGSLLAADGGYLVLTAEDLFEQRDVWAELKRTLISRSLSIHEELSNTLMPTVTLKPQPIPINIKVILIGHRELYEELLEHEPDFRKIFKVLAEFDEEMKLSDRTVRQYAAFIRRLCADESLGEFEPGAVAAVIEYGARLAGHQGKLSTRFGDIADLLREADYWRRQQGERRRVSARNVLTAVEEARRRRSLTEEKLRELIESEQIRVEVTGRRVGQVNGLIVHDTGSHMFGLPARI
ncbi:MAG TPA: ATP-binding protein, partial [Candidatus Polarisedimenticolia bacterium]|nr:ATP-binding protein [Candidatus Polarisedimenticolia bacterium]